MTSFISDPHKAVLDIEEKVREICEREGTDPAEGTMLLLTAACHMADTYSRKPVKEWAPVLAESLGHAIVAADEFFSLRKV
ncbi:hypothetical protein [Roseibium sp. Sym1]|uniref:hypothetical protein n=1 Tax=Roseibium sp. Sym1 TaxID=3016006 RepID=UPI0022B310C4|nr:hypothetical protein [Roseibium sp. Sym1]